MDSKSGSPAINNGVGLRDGFAKSPTKSKPTETTSKQMPASNSTEPKQRVIKQIVSLDSKKFKALGIESTILSALTKFNGKEKTVTKSKPISTLKNDESSSTSLHITSNESPVRKPTAIAAVSPSKQIITSQHSTSPQKAQETPPAKKIKVLSNVLLNENLLDLKSFKTISSSAPVDNKHISCVSKVPRPSQIKSVRRIEAEKVLLSQASTSVVLSESVTKATTVIEKNEQNPVKLPAKLSTKSSSKPIEKPLVSSPAKPPVKSQIRSPGKTESLEKISNNTSGLKKESKITEIVTDALKGFSVPELECSENQFICLQNEIQPKPIANEETSIEQQVEFEVNTQHMKSDETDVAQMEYKSESQTENHIQNAQNETKVLNDESVVHTDLCKTFTTLDTLSSDESSSDSDSDLDELIKEAQLIIENERKAEKIKSPVKRPRLIQKKFLNSLAEHVDKDRLIDDFLDSTIKSFRTHCDSTSESSDDDHEFVGTDMDRRNDSNEDETRVNDKIVGIVPEAEDKSITVAKKPDQNEQIERVEHVESHKPRVVPKKRKISLESENCMKRQKSGSIPHEIDNEIDSTSAQAPELTANSLPTCTDDSECKSKTNQTLEIVQGKCHFCDNDCFVPVNNNLFVLFIFRNIRYSRNIS